MGKEIFGSVMCPECGMDGAQVKRQKNGLYYRYCPDCDAQYFPRTSAASERLAVAAGVGAGRVADGAEAGDATPAATVTVTEAAPDQEKQKKRGFDFGLGG